MNANTYPSPAGYRSSCYIPQNRPSALLRTAHATGVSGMETVTHLMKSLCVPDHRKYQDFRRQTETKSYRKRTYSIFHREHRNCVLWSRKYSICHNKTKTICTRYMHFKEPEDAFLCQLQPATGPCPPADQEDHYTHENEEVFCY